MDLYGAVSPHSFLKGIIRDNRPTWFFEETGLNYRRISLDPTKGENKSEEYTKKFPFQKVPLLEKDGFTLSQSAAILHYLAQSSNQLYPTDAKDQAKHLEWMFFCMSDIEAHAAQIGVLMQMVEEKDRPHAQWMVQRAERLIARALDYLETHLNEKAYLMGDEFYAADILLGCCLYPIRNHSLITDRRNVKALLDRYYSRPAFKRMLEINGT